MSFSKHPNIDFVFKTLFAKIMCEQWQLQPPSKPCKCLGPWWVYNVHKVIEQIHLLLFTSKPGLKINCQFIAGLQSATAWKWRAENIVKSVSLLVLCWFCIQLLERESKSAFSSNGFNSQNSIHSHLKTEHGERCMLRVKAALINSV